MLILASVTDKLRLTTLSSSAVDVHVSWLDNISGGVQPGRTNTAIVTSTTTDICPSPGAGIYRSIKTIHIRNKGASSQTVTVIHTDGTTAIELHKASLGPGTTLEYIDEVGFITVPPSGVSTGSKVLLKTYIPTTAPNLIIGPEVLGNTDFDSFEFEWRLRPQPAVQDALGYLVSFDNGATYYTGANTYGFAYSYGATGGVGGGGGATLAYGYVGSPVGSATNQWWAHGRSRMDVPWKNAVNHLMVGITGGFQDGTGVMVVSFASYPGSLSPITNYQFYWQITAAAMNTDGFMKVYGIR